MRRPALLLAALLLLPGLAAQTTLTASETIEVTALAVSETSDGYRGIASELEVQVIAAGSGRVFVETKPLSETDMQASARLAARVAADTLGLDWEDYDYLIVMRSGSTIIGGPSAGGIMALALATALHNLEQPDDPWELDDRVAATGTINADGTIGPVGGIPAKAQGADDAGIRLFLYPAGLDNATTIIRQGDELVEVQVEMAAHCDALGILCQPAATLADLIERAAGVRITVDEVEVPDTSDYGSYIAPSVTAQVQTLADRIAAAEAARAQSALSDVEAGLVDEDLEQARQWSTLADDALADDEFYLAATYSFRGMISAREAARLIPFFDSGRNATVVADAAQDCRDAADDAVRFAHDLRADDITGWHAIAAAQVRAAAAAALAQQATSLAQGLDVNDAIASIDASAFCLERSQSVHWWGSLADVFPSGPALGDAASIARDSLERAREMVAYAGAVRADIGQAQADLDTAAVLFADGLYPGAALQAIEAEVGALVAMQTTAGSGIAPEVLTAAQQSASRAVLAVRAAGGEPLVSVSLLELAERDETNDFRLRQYWEARSAALIEPGEPTSRQFVRVPQNLFPADFASSTFAFTTGVLTGAMLVIVLAVVVALVRPR